MTHKRIICEKYFPEGMGIKRTARKTSCYSLQAVVRYTNDFKRIGECPKEGWSVERIAYATGP